MMFGASGAGAAIVVLYALLFPRRTLLVFFVLPLPAWLVGALMIGLDIYGAITRHSPFFPDQPIAFTAHLAALPLPWPISISTGTSATCSSRWPPG